MEHYEFDPCHPVQMWRDAMRERHWKQPDLAERLGVTRQAVSLLYQRVRRCTITPQGAITLERLFGIRAEVWLHRQANYQVARLRVYPQEEKV